MISPLEGSLLYPYGAALFSLLSVVGIGLFISAISMTQQQAILGAFLFIVPAILPSGFATPIENKRQSIPCAISWWWGAGANPNPDKLATAD